MVIFNNNNNYILIRSLYKQLDSNKIVSKENESLVVEGLRVIAEMVLYGDKKSDMLFDFFCEVNMLSLVLDLVQSPGGNDSSVVKV